MQMARDDDEGEVQSWGIKEWGRSVQTLRQFLVLYREDFVRSLAFREERGEDVWSGDLHYIFSTLSKFVL